MRLGIGVLTRVLGRRLNQQKVSQGVTIPHRQRRDVGVRLRAIRRAFGRNPIATATCVIASFILFRIALSYALAAKAGVLP